MRQVVIQVLPHGGHRRLVESAVILMPATKYRVEHGRQVSQALVTFQLKMPTAYRLSHCLEGVAADCGCEIHIDPTILVDCFTRTEGIAKKRELDTLEISLPIDVLAVHDPGFLGMQFKSALTKPPTDLRQGKLGLRQTPAVHHASSHPREPPPRVLTEPDVSVSAHPALPTQPVHTVIASARIVRSGGAPHPAANVPPAVGARACA